MQVEGFGELSKKSDRPDGRGGGDDCHPDERVPHGAPDERFRPEISVKLCVSRVEPEPRQEEKNEQGRGDGRNGYAACECVGVSRGRETRKGREPRGRASCSREHCRHVERDRAVFGIQKVRVRPVGEKGEKVPARGTPNEGAEKADHRQGSAADGSSSPGELLGSRASEQDAQGESIERCDHYRHRAGR